MAFRKTLDKEVTMSTQTQEQTAPSAPSSAPSAPRSGIKRRGFASMTEEKRRRVASLGGRTAHQMGRAHTFTSEEAQQAGRKGGRKVSENVEHMAHIGRIGGNSRWHPAPASQGQDKPATAQEG